MKHCFRPLAGMSCFGNYIGLPRGQTFPSPRGDELFLHTRFGAGRNRMFPSPRGDELFHNRHIKKRGEKSFRPLAGMSCFLAVRSALLRLMFPSPRGDELFRSSHYSCRSWPRFPSPRGDELFQQK